MFRLEAQAQDGVQTLTLHGMLDTLSAPQLKTQVQAITEAGHTKVVVDLTELAIIDSTGVGVLISLFKRTRAAMGRVYFAGLQGQPREIFRLLRLDRSFDLFPSVSAAVEQIRKP